jgi:hypothetical protein
MPSLTTLARPTVATTTAAWQRAIRLRNGSHGEARRHWRAEVERTRAAMIEAQLSNSDSTA